MTELDFTALNQPITKQDVAAFKQVKSARNGNSSTLVTRLVISVGIACYVFIFIYAEMSNQNGFMAVVIISVVLPLLAIGYKLASVNRLKTLAKLYKFATSNALQLIYDAGSQHYGGMIFDEGSARYVTEALRFSDGTEIGNYQYTTGSGKNRRTHYWGYVHIRLSRQLPHMVLDARDNNALGRFSNLPDVFNRNQTLKLEGNFNNYFTLYAPAEYARDALYVFTPDVMAALIDSGSKYDLEVMDNSLWIYSKGRFDMNEPTLRQLLKIADTIGGELGDQSAGYVDERVGDRSANIVAAPGKRLKKSINLIKVGTFVLIALYFLWVVLQSFE